MEAALRKTTRKIWTIGPPSSPRPSFATKSTLTGHPNNTLCEAESGDQRATSRRSRELRLNSVCEACGHVFHQRPRQIQIDTGSAGGSRGGGIPPFAGRQIQY